MWMEYVLYVLVFVILLRVLFQSKNRVVTYILELVTVLGFLGLLFQNVIWTYGLFGGYIIIVISYSLIQMYQVKEQKQKRFFILHSILFLGYIIAVSLPMIFPVLEVPKPTGQEEVGTKSTVITSDSTIELYGNSDGSLRRIKLQFWYPTTGTENLEKAMWIEDGRVVSRALANDFGLPYFVLDQTVQIESNSFQDGDIVQSVKKYPVVIISHGWRGFRNLHTDFAEELASNGYFVVGIDHTFGSVATVFEHNDISYLDLDALRDRDVNENFLADANQLVETYASDIILTIDYLEQGNELNSEAFFSGMLRVDQIGLLGHSTGGGAGVSAALLDDRISAVFGMDSWVEPLLVEQLSTGLDIPSLFVRSEDWETGYNNSYLYTLIDNSSETSTLFQIDGTTHFDFAMVYMYSPLTKYIGFSGETDSLYLVSILRTMMNDFFDTHLKLEQNQEVDITPWNIVNEVDLP